MEIHAYTGPMVPRRDEDFARWLEQFSGIIAKDAARFMMVQCEAEVLVRYAKKFRNALRIATTIDTRNPVTVLEKNQTRTECEQLFRAVAAQIKANDGISNSDKINLNVRPKRLSWSAIPAPVSSPVVWVVNPLNGGHLMQYRDSEDFAVTSRKAKPYGVIRMEMRIALTRPENGEQPRLEETTEVLSTTKSPFIIWHEHEDDGKVMTCWGRWVTRTNKTGPWGAPVSMRIAFAGAGNRKRDEDDEEGERRKAA